MYGMVAVYQERVWFYVGMRGAVRADATRMLACMLNAVPTTLVPQPIGLNAGGLACEDLAGFQLPGYV